MEPAKPIDKINQKISFKILNNEEKEKYYIIDILLQQESLIIHMKNCESKIKLVYENHFTLSDFLKIHKYFKMFESLEEIAKNIKELHEKDLLSILKNTNDNYDLILNVELNKENIEIKLELLFKDNNDLVQLLEIVKSFEEKYIAYEKENKELKNLLSEYKSKLDKNEAQLQQLMKLHQMNSSIMFNLDELNLVSNQIEKNMNKKVNYLKQLYKGTRDGEGMNNIKSRAFNINNIVLLVRSKSGYRFGGFTSICFEENTGSDYYKSDDKCFVFSLDRKDTYPIVKKEQAIRLSPDRAFMLGPNDIWVYGNFLSGKSGNGNGGYTGQATFDYKGLDAALSGINCQYFDLQEVEAYQVIYVD